MVLRITGFDRWNNRTIEKTEIRSLSPTDCIRGASLVEARVDAELQDKSDINDLIKFLEALRECFSN